MSSPAPYLYISPYVPVKPWLVQDRATHVTKKYIAMVMDLVIGMLSAFKVADIVHGVFNLLVFPNVKR